MKDRPIYNLAATFIAIIVPSIGMGWTLCPIDQNSYFDNCLGSYSFKNEEGQVTATYIGSWKQDKKHGFGTYRYSDGDVFAGNYNSNQKDAIFPLHGITGRHFSRSWGFYNSLVIFCTG